jgi:hypothetical protein
MKRACSLNYRLRAICVQPRLAFARRAAAGKINAPLGQFILNGAGIMSRLVVDSSGNEPPSKEARRFTIFARCVIAAERERKREAKGAIASECQGALVASTGSHLTTFRGTEKLCNSLFAETLLI